MNNTGMNASHIYISEDGNDAVIKGSNFTGGSSHGIVIFNTSDITISSSVFSDMNGIFGAGLYLSSLTSSI